MASYTQFRNGFEITSGAAIDKRILLTKAEMLLAEENYMLPEIYFCICADDGVLPRDPDIGKIYLFDNKGTWSTETGHYRQLDSTILGNVALFEQALANSNSFQSLVVKVGDAEQGTGLAGDVKALQEDVVGLREDVDDLDTRVEELKEEVEDPESGIAARIAQLETRASAAEQRMTEIEARIAAIKLDNIEGKISGEKITL